LLADDCVALTKATDIVGKEKKAKKAKTETPEEDDGRTYEILVSRISKIATPLAGKKLTKKIYKVMKVDI
jgi:hypothetical protein